MNLNKFFDKLVLITGATQGIGLQTALAFARNGARVVITYKFGTAEENEVVDLFKSENLTAPIVRQSDAGNEEDINDLLEELSKNFSSIEAFISNVAFGPLTPSFDDYNEKDFYRSIQYTAWPLFGITNMIKDKFNQWPRYVVGLTSFGSEQYLRNYDLIGASKSVLESMVQYFSYHLFDEDIRINLVKPQYIETQNLKLTMGECFPDFIRKYGTEGLLIKDSEVSKVILMLCSGLLDGVSGQTIKLDGGSQFSDNIMRYYDQRTIFNM